MQPGQTAYVAAAPHAPTYETYQQPQTAVPQYAFATRSQVRIMRMSLSFDLLLMKAWYTFSPAVTLLIAMCECGVVMLSVTAVCVCV